MADGLMYYMGVSHPDHLCRRPTPTGSLSLGSPANISAWLNVMNGPDAIRSGKQVDLAREMGNRCKALFVGLPRSSTSSSSLGVAGCVQEYPPLSPSPFSPNALRSLIPSSLRPSSDSSCTGHPSIRGFHLPFRAPICSETPFALQQALGRS